MPHHNGARRKAQGVRRKGARSKIPNSKIQIPNKFQISNDRNVWAAESLEFDLSDLFGAWCLEFGA
jgi:hypothetical protein